MRRPAAVVFDCGSTLIHIDVDPLRSHLLTAGIGSASSRQLRSAFHAALAIEQGLRALPGDAASHMDLAQAWCMLASCPSDTSPIFAAALSSPLFYSAVDADTHQVLGGLQARGIRLGVVANGEGQLAEELRDTRLSGYFDVSIDSFSFGASKPDAAIFRSACEQLGVSTSEAWFVGDSLVNDYIGAYRAGFLGSILFDKDNLWSSLPVPRVTSLSQLITMVDIDG